MFPSPVGFGIPPWAGGEVRGVLVYNSQEARIVSGVAGPGQWLAASGIATGPGSGFTSGVRYHVEGHVTSIMLQCSIREAILYINRRPCVGPPANCHVAVPRLLLPGYVLHVVYESADGTMALTGRFVGGDAWHEP